MAMLIGHDLELDVMRINDQFLDVNIAVSESLFRFRRRARGNAGTRLASLCAARIPRPPPPATALIMTGIADFLGDFERLLLVFDDAVAPGRDRNARFARVGARRILVAHRVHRARRRADEFDFAALAHFREVRVLREKTVAGMDRIDIADFGRAHDAVDLQVTFRARRGADADRFIRQLHMERIDIRFGINGERANARVPCRRE